MTKRREMCTRCNRTVRTTLTAALWQKIMNEYKLQHDNNHQFHIDKVVTRLSVLFMAVNNFICVISAGQNIQGDGKSPAAHRLMAFFFMNKCIG